MVSIPISDDFENSIRGISTNPSLLQSTLRNYVAAALSSLVSIPILEHLAVSFAIRFPSARDEFPPL